MRFPAFAFVLAAAVPAFAAVPEKGEGTFTLQGGFRAFLPGNDAYINEQGARHSPLQPQGIAGFGYQYDEELHFKIELGLATDTYKFPDGELSVRTIPILLGVDTALMRGSWYTLYGGGSLGYALSSSTRAGRYNEANTTAFALAIGIRIKLTEKLGLVVEDRYTYAKAQVDVSSMNLLSVGGNLLSAGLLFHFLQPDDKGHPQAP